VRDRDGVYAHVVRRRLWALGFRNRPTAPGSPWQNAYVERLIGSARRECLDHVIVFGERHLRRIVPMYAAYYTEARTRLSLANDTPISRPIERAGRVTAGPMVGGLHHRYARI
jgi:transposase InsO family protein